MIGSIKFILSFASIWFRLLKPSGVRAIAAENIALRKQLIVLTRHQKRSPKLTIFEKITFGILTAMINPKRLSRIAIVLKPTTLLKFHKALVQRKYQLLFSNKKPKKPGPKGPDKAVIEAIVEMKQRNPRYGYRRIAMQISNAFGIELDKDQVRRILAKHYNNPKDRGPSWLTFIGHMKDSLWSVDLFRCESIILQTHWVMVVMDQFTRRIIGFAVHKGDVNGVSICCMFNEIISGKKPPNYLSSDNDPLFRFHRWKANLRIIDVEEIKSIPYTPTSHPFIERVIGTVRRELLDQTLFWHAKDLQNKLETFQCYYNEERGHCGIEGSSPSRQAGEKKPNVILLNNYRWKKYCRGLFELPIAA